MSEQKRILILENDDFYVEILSTFTKLFLNASTLFVKTSMEALGACKEAKPDVVIVDLDLPGKDSFQFLERLRDDCELKTIPVIAISSGFEEQEALGAGSDAFLRKPFKVRELEGLIEKLYRRE
jgi:CheY-like chemotaxis protein